MKSMAANVFGFLCLLTMAIICVFIILDKGAEKTLDGYPTTSAETYLALVIAAAIFAILAWILKKTEMDRTFECPYCHHAVTYKPFKKSGVIKGENVTCPRCQGKIYVSTRLFKKQIYGIP